ncbi:MAG: N-acetylneuraminate synthase [Candidatus Helarchaeota archaeon]
MQQIKIADKWIGEKQPCFIIAEAGVNHDGDLNKAKKLIDIAKDAKVDAVKFQTWITEELSTKNTKKASYQIENTGAEESQFEMLKKLELSQDDFIELKEYSEKKKIIFLSTGDEEKSIEFLYNLGVPAFKIGSAELTNLRMLKLVAQKNIPIILSTGMGNIDEIREAVNEIYKTGNNKLILLHCTSEYPTNYEDVNLNAMLTIKTNFNSIVGYSDHTLGTLVPIVAVSLGAKVIEKHFTYSKSAEGPDHICSLDPMELKEMVTKIRQVEIILGEKVKKPTEKELEIKKLIRKTIVASMDIPKSTKISNNMLALKRSNGSLEPKMINKILGLTTKRKFQKDEPISLKDLK